MHASPTTPAYSLPAQLTAETAAAVTEEMRQWPLIPHSRLTLNASGVETLSSSGAQILLSLHKAATAAGAEILIADYKPFFSHALSDMGLGWLLNPPKN